MYTGIMCIMIGQPLLLGSFVGLAMGVVQTALNYMIRCVMTSKRLGLFAIEVVLSGQLRVGFPSRITLEEAYLQRHLEGYEDYMKQVRGALDVMR
jgi:protein-S-isoprenylcysteine O-methyltransferase Ste14